MRLWHHDLIMFLPNSQLVAQWRELNSIYKKKDKHILINYVYEYSKRDLFIYSGLVIGEMISRKMKIKSWENYRNYFADLIQDINDGKINKNEYYDPFKNHHTNRYLLQCFYNLQEKYDRGQKDFSKIEYNLLESFVYGKSKN